ncbi:sporulation protein [Priestia flexa]|uniref:Sporulation protein n=1 Tax=Priestia flexa TaxID=86664 RepID=A0A8I1MGM0_9BACI|nr:sporulation protein [Priestia flexa]MBN8252354.1 sporulation protein [Priestia flexa]
MLKKIFAKMGVGAAKVDLILNESTYTLGEHVEGKIKVQGGKVEQHINFINVELWLEVRGRNGEFHTHKVTSIPIVSSFLIREGEEKEWGFKYDLPMDIPISASNCSYFFQTHLDIEGGADAKDRDDIRIKAPEALYQFVEALESLGFREKHHSGQFNGYKQEFEFFPTSQFQRRIRELEFEVAVEDKGLRILLELDLPSFGREREIKREISFSTEELSNNKKLQQSLHQIIEEMIDNPASYEHFQPSHYQRGEYKRGMSGLGGAMGGFAAGMIGGMLLGEVMDDMFEDVAFDDIQEDLEGADDLFDGDFFSGDDEW